MAAASHQVIINSSGVAVKCYTGKKAEKAQADVERMQGYTLKSYSKDSCPCCNDGAEGVTYDGKIGQCHACKHGVFTHKFVNHDMIRVCKQCGALFNLVTLKPFKER
jgi:hypothetical protein